jgi:hypothetical protein
VLWRNGKTTTGVPQSELRKVFGDLPGAEPSITSLVGKWMQIGSLPIIDLGEDPPFTGYPPKSPAAAGLVIEAFGTNAYDELNADAARLVISSEDGRGFFQVPMPDPAGDDPPVYIEQPGRRNV